MKINLTIIITLSTLFTFCNQIKMENSKNITNANITKGNTDQPLIIDNDFNTFIEYFSKDSLFQISRVKLPLKVKQFDSEKDNYQIKYFGKSNFIKMDFRIKKSKGDFDQWKQDIKIEKNKATIEITGIDNGIIVLYYFEKRNGKWTLIEVEDSST